MRTACLVHSIRDTFSLANHINIQSAKPTFKKTRLDSTIRKLNLMKICSVISEMKFGYGQELPLYAFT
jgi:hypothetical protein